MTITVPEVVQNEESLGDNVGQFFVTGPADVATKASHFYCRICRKDVFVLTHGHHEVLRHFQGSNHLPPRPTSEVGDARLGSAGL